MATKSHTEHGKMDLSERDNLSDSSYAFPKQRKEPLTDAAHVRNALARFNQVEGVSDADRERPSPTSRRPPSATVSMSAKAAGKNWTRSNNCPPLVLRGATPDQEWPLDLLMNLQPVYPRSYTFSFARLQSAEFAPRRLAAA